MAGKTADFRGDFEDLAHGGVGGVEAEFAEAIVRGGAAVPPVEFAGEAVDAVEREAECLADFADGAAPAITDDFGGEGGAVASVLGI